MSRIHHQEYRTHREFRVRRGQYRQNTTHVMDDFRRTMKIAVRERDIAMIDDVWRKCGRSARVWSQENVTIHDRTYTVFPDFYAAMALDSDVLRLVYERGCPASSDLLRFLHKAFDISENDNDEARTAICECMRTWTDKFSRDRVPPIGKNMCL